VIAALHLMISGRVQGVGFRAAMCQQAAVLGLQGWVRNRRDGRVEAVVVGRPEQVDLLRAWARHGPRGAIVTSIEQRAATAAEEDDALGAEFEARPTE
jgi:acylphosphatase